MPAAARGRGQGRGRPPKIDSTLVTSIGRGKASILEDALSKPKHRDREGIDTANILETRREHLPSKKKMGSCEDLSDGETEGKVVAEKNKRVTFDFDYTEDSQEEEEEELDIATTASLDLDNESSDPLSPTLLPTKAARAVKTTKAVKPARSAKLPRKADVFVPPKDICIEVPYLNAQGVEITTRFSVDIEATELDDFIAEMLRHIHCPDLPPARWPKGLLYKTTADMIKKRYPLETDTAWVKLKDEFIEDYKRKGVSAHASVYLTPEFPRDLQFTLKQRKTSKTLGAVRHGAKKNTGPLTNLDDSNGGVETTDDPADAAVKFKGAVMPATDLMDVLKNCKDHKNRYCHRDHTGKHHVLNFPLYSMWAKLLNTGTPGVTIYSPPNDPAFEGIPAGPPNSNANVHASVPTPAAPTAPQNVPQMYMMPTAYGQQFNPAFPYQFNMGFGYPPQFIPNAAAAYPAPAVRRPPAATDEPGDVSAPSINASDIPSPFPTIETWLKLLEDSQKVKVSSIARDWDGIRQGFVAQAYNTKRIDMVYDMGPSRISEIFAIDIETAAYLHEKIGASYQ